MEGISEERKGGLEGEIVREGEVVGTRDKCGEEGV